MRGNSANEIQLVDKSSWGANLNQIEYILPKRGVVPTSVAHDAVGSIVP